MDTDRDLIEALALVERAERQLSLARELLQRHLGEVAPQAPRGAFSEAMHRVLARHYPTPMRASAIWAEMQVDLEAEGAAAATSSQTPAQAVRVLCRQWERRGLTTRGGPSGSGLWKLAHPPTETLKELKPKGTKKR